MSPVLETSAPVVISIGGKLSISYYERATLTDGLSIYVCLYPSSAHSFDPIVMKLGMDTPWDPESVMG